MLTFFGSYHYIISSLFKFLRKSPEVEELLNRTEGRKLAEAFWNVLLVEENKSGFPTWPIKETLDDWNIFRVPVSAGICRIPAKLGDINVDCCLENGWVRGYVCWFCPYVPEEVESHALLIFDEEFAER